MTKLKADIGVIGGSGFYSLFTKGESIAINTPYGLPSDQFMIGEIAGKRVAFLPRHGEKHQYPPHVIPYRANIWGFKKLGVKFIISPCAAGSLQPEIRPGDFVIIDQFVDRTWGRKDSFYDGPKTIHIAADTPFCPNVRKHAIETGKKLNYHIHQNGTVVVINGPRFSTKAESQWFRSCGWQVINMTVYPEVVLARELEMCYLNISLITDYDTGLIKDKKVRPVSLQQVLTIFKKNNEKVKVMIFEMIKKIDVNKICTCHTALKQATL